MYVCVLLIEIPSRPQKIFTSSRSFCLSLSIVDFSSNCANTRMKFDLCNGNLWPGYFFFCCEHSRIDNICFHLIYAFIHIDNSNEYISIRFGFLLNLTDRNTKHTKCSINSYYSMWQSSCRIKSQRIQFPKCMIGGMDSCEIRKMKVKHGMVSKWHELCSSRPNRS